MPSIKFLSTSIWIFNSSFGATISINSSNSINLSATSYLLTPYTSTEIISELWPNNCDTAFGLKLFFNKRVQYVALKSWNLISGKPQSFNNCFQYLKWKSLLLGFPYVEQQMNP